jgi:hypothetical protein
MKGCVHEMWCSAQLVFEHAAGEEQDRGRALARELVERARPVFARAAAARKTMSAVARQTSRS